MSDSPFAVRGVIEGFYGHPWTHEQRLALIDFVGARGMNEFVYSPKDDPLLRDRWRTHYQTDALERLRQLAERCHANDMTFAWCISPGLSIRYSDPDDVATLLARIDRVLGTGVDRVGLFFDDIRTELQYPADREAFGDLETAQATVANQVREALPSHVPLIVCPTLYWGRGTEPSLARLADSLEPSIDLFWTGRAICAPALDLDDARVFEQTAGRPPTYWDNYPVNDVAMGYELHIGPYRRRDPELWRASRGIVANAMELYEASRIPLATIADFLADPAGYEPEASWRRAMRDVVGEQDLDAFALFADNVRSSCLEDGDAFILDDVLRRAVFELEYGDASVAVAELRELADRLLAAAEHLLRGPVQNRALMAEIRPWLVAFEIGAEALSAVADLAVAGRLDEDGPAVLAPFLIRLRRARVRVFGDAMEMTLSVLSGMMFRPGEVP